MLLFVFFLGTNALDAQNGIFWGYNITFQFEDFKSNNRGVTVVGIDFLLNSGFPTQQSSKSLNMTLNTNSVDSTKFNLMYSFMGIGGRSPDTVKCPEIYLRLQLKYREVGYEKLIPFMFKPAKGPLQTTTINKINLHDYIDSYSKPIVITVSADGSYTIKKQFKMQEKPIVQTLIKIPQKEIK